MNEPDFSKIAREGLKPLAARASEPVNETLWRTMKMAQIFTARELAELASTDGNPVKVSAASRYCARLADAGVLSRTTRRKTDVGYRLVKNLGAKAPKLLAIDAVFDPNAKMLLPPYVPREVRP